MNIALNSVPVLAVVLAQVAEGNPALTVYGPLGLICLWLMAKDERSRRDSLKRESDAREDNAKLREEVRQVAHNLKGVSRGLLYVTATHGPAGLRDVAEKELERLNAQPK